VSPCAVDRCDRTAITRGWCDKHYRRFKKTGDPLELSRKGPAPIAPIDRLLAKTTIDSGDCWLYQGWLQKNGYARIYLPKPIDGHVNAHRFSYEYFITEIPAELEIDHLCNQRNCMNPWHMEPVSHAENMRRGTDRLWGNRTYCNRGHALTDADVRTIPGTQPGWIARTCRQCYHENNRKKTA
jgi:hypothetical protein